MSVDLKLARQVADDLESHALAQWVRALADEIERLRKELKYTANRRDDAVAAVYTLETTRDEQQREIERLKALARQFIEDLKCDPDIHDWTLGCRSEREVEQRMKRENATAEAPCIFKTFEEEIER